MPLKAPTMVLDMTRQELANETMKGTVNWNMVASFRYDHMDIVRLLVDHGADVNIRGDDGLTPLHFCARYKVHGPNSAATYTRPLKPVNAMNHFSKDNVGKIINNSDKNKNAEQLPDSVIEYLAYKSANVNEKDKYGLSPLHYAAMRGNDDATNELLECAGINIESQDEQQLTPLHMACSYGQVKVTRILLENGARIENMGEKRQTSLHKAASVGDATLVQMLVDCTVQIHGEGEVERLLKIEDIDANT